MAYTPAQIIGWAKMAEPLSLIGEAKKRNGDPDLTIKIKLERQSVEWFYNQLYAPGYSPSTAELSLLQKIADYLYALIGPYQSTVIGYGTGVAPTITVQPVSQSVASGGDAIFSVSATGTPALTYQWYKNGVAMSGKTSSVLSLTGVTSGDAANYTVKVTNAYGSATSSAATLTVGSLFTAYWLAMTSDPYPTIHGGSDPYTYTNSIAFTHGSDITFPVADSDANKFFVFKVPIGEPTKTTYELSGFDTGTIPGIAMWDKQTVGSFDYYISRSELSYNVSTTMILKS